MAKQTRFGFYRAHERVTFDNTVVDLKTGELVYLPSMTKQEFQTECDINNVIKSFSASGMLRHVSARAAEGAYQDLPDSYDFQESLHQVQRAREAFMTLPAKIRSRFGNDPAEFLAFSHDPANLDELRTLGLATPVAPAPAPVEVIIKAPPGSSSSTGGAGGTGGNPPAGPSSGPS